MLGNRIVGNLTVIEYVRGVHEKHVHLLQFLPNHSSYDRALTRGGYIKDDLDIIPH